VSCTSKGAGMSLVSGELLQSYCDGIRLFNSGAFFDAHEVLEDVWRPCVGEERKFLQGLIQVAVAFHHYSKGNLRGARSLLERGVAKLNNYPDTYADIRLNLLRASLNEWRETLGSDLPPPALPQIILRQNRPAVPDKIAGL
jgi:predicted metal-dependent hydrolase